MKEILIVLGMHRSGTSALTGVLKILGADLGFEDESGAFDNPKGFFENPAVLFVNRALLKHFASSWKTTKCLPRNWQKDPELKETKEIIKEYIKENFNKNSLLAVKEPRMCNLLPFWLDIFLEMQINPKCIIPIRNPEEVALSLQKRNDIKIKKSLILWTKHMVNAEFYSRNLPRTIISFDGLLKNPEYYINNLQKVLNFKFLYSYTEKETEIKEFLETGLKHHNSDIETYYEELPIAYEYFKYLKKLEFENLSNNQINKLEDFRQKYLKYSLLNS